MLQLIKIVSLVLLACVVFLLFYDIYDGVRFRFVIETDLSWSTPAPTKKLPEIF